MDVTIVQSTYWDKEAVIGQTDKDNYSKYVVSACEKGGKQYINIREWYFTSKDPTWKPGKAGMTLPVTNNGDIAAQVISLMQDARQYLYWRDEK